METTKREKALLQHKADIAYSKYLQSLQLKRLLKFKNRETEQNVDALLAQQKESLEEKIEETENMKKQIENVTEYSELFTALERINKSITDFNSMDFKGFEDFTRNIQSFCDVMHLKGFKITKGEEDKLIEILEKLSNITDEITCVSSESFVKFVEKCDELKVLATKINVLQRSVEDKQKKVNSLVLKASSLAISSR